MVITHYVNYKEYLEDTKDKFKNKDFVVVPKMEDFTKYETKSQFNAWLDEDKMGIVVMWNDFQAKIKAKFEELNGQDALDR